MQDYQAYIDVIAAYMRGEKIEYRHSEPEDEAQGTWQLPAFLTFNFAKYEYRIAPPEPKVPDSIDWSHIVPQYTFMARDGDGYVRLFQSEPRPNPPYSNWRAEPGLIEGQAEIFASYRRGNMEWQDSLVERPKP